MIEEFLEELNKIDDYVDDFINRTVIHIERVNKYGSKIGREYPNHDEDKLTTLLDGYALMKKKDRFGGSNSKDNFDGLTSEEGEKLNEATLIHITTNPHHPEYWYKGEMKSFDRTNPPEHLDCMAMPKEALEEMCADWCAMSEEFNNTPFEWLEKTVPSRWVFSEDQISFINDVLEKMWGKEND